MVKTNEVFLFGVGIGYITAKYHGDLLYGIMSVIAARQRRADIERMRIVDVFGDEV